MTFAPRPSSPRPADHLVRAALAVLKSEVRSPLEEESVIRHLYPGDDTSALLLRAATSPASLTSAQWAGALASTAVIDFVSGLGPVSAASQLIGTALQVDLGRYAHAMVPGLIPTASLAIFVAEGREIPVSSMVFSGAMLGPTKVAAIIPITRETLKAPRPKPSSGPRSRSRSGLGLMPPCSPPWPRSQESAQPGCSRA